ncbi:MAG TPA: NAD(+) diphosphatase [Steroidobacteraceae bacterium]|jgi:NAD+ diphosphatase|nr:NAD(+) diphosphatase [Steroidobacteraceae bacterium]
MHQQRPNFFSGQYVDRRSEAREDPDWIAAARADAGSRYLLNRGSTQLVHATPAGGIAFLDNAAPLVRSADPASFALLGWFRGERVVLIDLPGTDAFEPPAGTHFAELRPLAAVLDADEAGLLAYARALGTWRARHHHCGVCGARTMPVRAGHCLACTNPECAQEFFPRIDPAIIVLVSDGDRALLGRQAGWPERRYSTIAGFVEPGESLEDAVVREVAEETGVAVTEVRYHSSQPWPFPSSVMLGFKARAPADSEVRVGGELEDARWFTREQVHSGEALTPPTQSISWRLIESWLKGSA